MLFNLNSEPQSWCSVTTVLSCWLSPCWQPCDSWQMYRWWMFSPLCKDDGIKVQTNRVIDGKSRATLIRPGPHSVMYGKASCGQFVSEKWETLCREGHKERKKKRRENKEIIIRGGGGRGEYPKLVFIVVILARCYGNRQISFQGRVWGPWLLPVPGIQWGTPGGGGWAGNTGFAFACFCCFTHLSAGLPIAPSVIYGV